MRHALFDWRLSFRSLLRSPGYSLASVLVLGLGIGVSVAALAIARQALLAPLPYARSDRLVLLFEATPSGSLRLPSNPAVDDWRSQSKRFEGIEYVTGTQALLRETTGPELITLAVPTGGFFPLMAARPLLGRTISPDDDQRGDRVVVLSHRLWRRRYGGRTDLIGQRIPLGDGGATVIGVMPEGFQFPEWAEAWMPASTAPASIQRMLLQRNNHADSRVIARLRPEATIEQARAEISVVAGRLARAYPDDSRDWTQVSVTPMSEYVLSFTQAGAGQSLTARIGLVVGAALLVLTLGCANVATLGLVRGLSRGQELAVRAALGASRGQVARYLLVESVLLALAGGMVGSVAGYGLIGLVRRWDPTLFPRLTEIELDPVFVLGAAALSLVVALASGLIPALRATPTSLSQILTGARGQVGGGRATNRLQQGLIVAQVALAFMLLAGAGLLLKSLKRVIETPIGVEVERLSAVGLWPPSDRYAEPARLLAFYRAALEAIQRVPGVTSVALVNHVPLGGASMPTTVSIEGRDPPKDQLDQANFRTVSPSYFEVAGIPVIRGRTFTEADLAGPNGGLVVNRAFADRYWPGQDPIGRRVTIYKSARWLPDFGQPLPSTVIGVVGDVRHFGPETSPAQEVYLPYTWNPWQWGNLMIRSSLSPEALRDPVRRALLAIEPDLPVEGAAQRFETFDQRLVELRAPRRLLTVGLAGLAGTALAIAMVGLSAILAYHVTRRRAELGIRAALGASRAQVLGLVMKEGLALTGIGVAIGLVGSLLSSQVLASLLFGVSARDVGVFLLVPLVLFAVATVAVYHPARRAAKVDPVETMR